MANASELSFRTVDDPGLVIISPNDPGAMVQYAEECRTLGIPFIFDPGQQCARMSGDELREGIAGARLVICNDYEFELIRQKTGMGEDGVLEQAQTLVITRGEEGCSLYEKGSRVDVKAIAPPHRRSDRRRRCVPRRVHEGDGGGKPLKECAQLGSVAATYALEHLGGQSHAYTMKEFVDRYAEHFGPLSL